MSADGEFYWKTDTLRSAAARLHPPAARMRGEEEGERERGEKRKTSRLEENGGSTSSVN